MTKAETQRLGALLTNENLAQVLEYASESCISTDTALNLIVLEWAEKAKIGRLKATDEAITLSEIKERLTNIDAQLYDISGTVNIIDSKVE